MLDCKLQRGGVELQMTVRVAPADGLRLVTSHFPLTSSTKHVMTCMPCSVKMVCKLLLQGSETTTIKDAYSGKGHGRLSLLRLRQYGAS